MALYPYTINPYMVYEPQTLLGIISCLRLGLELDDAGKTPGHVYYLQSLQE